LDLYSGLYGCGFVLTVSKLLPLRLDLCWSTLVFV